MNWHDWPQYVMVLTLVSRVFYSLWMFKHGRSVIYEPNYFAAHSCFIIFVLYMGGFWSPR